MGHYFRGATVVWNNQSVGNGDKSAPAYTWGKSIAVFIDNLGSNPHTFALQAAETGVQQPGLNEFDPSLTDGGLTWFNVNGFDSLTVAANAKTVWNVPNFTPSLVRLICTAGTANAITAVIAVYGPA
ncbi:MAG: hypothetical protein QXU32_01495 [Nitrososphaerales archaeon]